MTIKSSLRATWLGFILLVNIAWAQPVVDNKTPEARYLHQMVYDEGNRQILVYGGNGGYKVFDDLWSFSGTGWKKLSEGGPKGRVKAGFAYDIHRKRAVLFGGSGPNNELLEDTWEWNGNEWRQIQVSGPSARNHSMAAYDRKRQVTLLFGGVGPAGLLNDTWSFDGKDWKRLDVLGPADCLPHGMIYDEMKERPVLITLSVIRDPADESHARNDMWEWTGDSWKKIPGATSVITSSNLQALAAFGRSEIVLFDGSDASKQNGKTWNYEQDHWAPIAATGPPPRVGHSMIYDKSLEKTILFGGGSNTNLFKDLWAWDGKIWKELK